ncbi:hypothetical protein [Bacillus sp. AK128]
MKRLEAVETMIFFRSYGVKCEENLVQQWLIESQTERKSSVSEEDLYQFNEWCRWKGTPYEEGIDEKTKMDRLLEENKNLKNEIRNLRNEKARIIEQLEVHLEKLPF